MTVSWWNGFLDICGHEANLSSNKLLLCVIESYVTAVILETFETHQLIQWSGALRLIYDKNKDLQYSITYGSKRRRLEEPECGFVGWSVVGL